VKRSASSHLLSTALVSAVVVLLVVFNGCSPKAGETVVASVGKTPITIADYEKLYERSNGSREAGVKAPQEERERFLDLMIRYRKKLADAYDRGLDRRPELMAEIQQYKGSLAASYLTDRVLVGPSLKKMYDRSLEEIRVSHVLIQIKAGATPEDTAAVLKKVNEVIQMANAGKDFGELAANFSEDPSAKNNRGDLYYFSVGRMVPEFEDAAFAMKKGDISQKPVMSRWGAHILKIVDRKPTSGSTHCGHIMIRFESQSPSPEDTLKAYEKVRKIQDSLKAGMAFAALAKAHSDDGGSSENGGDLGWFERGRWPQPFDEAAFMLKPGENSPIVRTQYGYHIINCSGVNPPRSFEESRQELQNKYQQQRFQGEYNTFMDGIRREVKYSRNDSIATLFTHAFDTTKTVRDSAWTDTLTASIRKAAIFRFAKGPVSVDSVLGIIKSHAEWNNLSLHPQSLTPTLDKVSEQLIFGAKADLMEQQDPEFAALLREYKEGILLYQAEQEQVWNKVAPNDSSLKLFFENNRDKFMFPDRVVFTELRAASAEMANDLYARVREGKSFEQIIKEDSARIGQPSAFVVAFPRGGKTLSKSALKTVDSVATALTHESDIRLLLIAAHDTTALKGKGKGKAKPIAVQRLELIKAKIAAKYGIAPERIMTEVRQKSYAGEKKESIAWIETHVDLQILGRQPHVINSLESVILAPAADERAAHADSLKPSEVCAPFPYKVGFSIVRLQRREPARRKEYEEAGAEVSSLFQDYEAKRLEKEWMERVERAHPVVVNKETLRQAFVSPQK
jgi:peptidyl-prolyl cis-trans isomerase SurA